MTTGADSVFLSNFLDHYKWFWAVTGQQDSMVTLNLHLFATDPGTDFQEAIYFAHYGIKLHILCDAQCEPASGNCPQVVFCERSVAMIQQSVQVNNENSHQNKALWIFVKYYLLQANANLLFPKTCFWGLVKRKDESNIKEALWLRELYKNYMNWYFHSIECGMRDFPNAAFLLVSPIFICKSFYYFKHTNKSL